MTVSGPKRVARDQSRLNLIDYVLMGLGASLAAYTAGMSIGRDDTAQFLATGVVIGTSLSYLVRVLLGATAVMKVDGILYAAAFACAIVGFPTLNALLPEEGFARDVMMAGVLAWMIVLGSALTWRDGTLLFQAIPSVALFGLVGCYDTFAYAPYLFFGFLVCLAIVLARANRREMMRQAVESGYFNRADAPSTPQEFPEQSSELYEDIRRGPWRWLAGPEWALASALVIILLSRIGAPALQEAAKPITGAVKIMAPRSVRDRLREAASQQQATSYTVGRGPNRSLSDHVVYTAHLDRARYLRTAAYEIYTGRGWSTNVQSIPREGPVGDAVAWAVAQMGEQTHAARFQIRPQDYTLQIPLPAEPGGHDMSLYVRPDGGGNTQRGGSPILSGNLIEATTNPRNAPTRLEGPGADALYDASRVTDRVREFAQNAARGSLDDYDKAARIANEIAAQVKYNINAAAVPADQDPADWFLFGNKEGYCDLFATSMVLCARAVGLPARYVIGYLPEKGDGQGNFVLREADYHAWCEIGFEGVGWVVFDATEGAEQVEGGERGSSDEERPWYTAAWVVPAFRGVLGVLAIGLGVAVFRNRRPATRPLRWEVHRAYVGYERALRRTLGRRRHPGETVEAYALAAGGEAPGLGRRFERALYGPAEPTEAEIRALREATRGLRKR